MAGRMAKDITVIYDSDRTSFFIYSNCKDEVVKRSFDLFMAAVEERTEGRVPNEKKNNDRINGNSDAGRNGCTGKSNAGNVIFRSEFRGQGNSSDGDAV